MVGYMKSGLVSRGPPRSSTTMERPVSASSLARMPPVQPSPTMTMSADLSFVAMTASSAQVPDGLRGHVVRLVAVFPDVVLVHPDRAGEADHLPHRGVAIAAIHRVGEIPFHGVVQERAEEDARRHLREFRLARLDRLERRDAVGDRQLVEGLAAARL